MGFFTTPRYLSDLIYNFKFTSLFYYSSPVDLDLDICIEVSTVNVQMHLLKEHGKWNVHETNDCEGLFRKIQYLFNKYKDITDHWAFIIIVSFDPFKPVL